MVYQFGGKFPGSTTLQSGEIYFHKKYLDGLPIWKVEKTPRKIFRFCPCGFAHMENGEIDKNFLLCRHGELESGEIAKENCLGLPIAHVSLHMWSQYNNIWGLRIRARKIFQIWPCGLGLAMWRVDLDIVERLLKKSMAISPLSTWALGQSQKTFLLFQILYIFSGIDIL